MAYVIITSLKRNFVSWGTFHSVISCTIYSTFCCVLLTLQFPCFAFFVIDCSQKQTLLIKRFNFVFIIDLLSVSQKSVEAVTAENEEQYNLSDIN